MGIDIQMMMKLWFLGALIATLGSSTMDASIVKEDFSGSPADSLVDHAAAFSKMTSTEFISTVISSKHGDAAECQTFATNVISDIGTSVHAAQDLLDAIDTGSGCASEGQAAVIKTRAALTTAQDN